MEVVPDYEDRGMKKWRPFYSSPELRLSLNSVMNEFKLPYHAPPQMTAEEIDQALTRAFRYQERVKVTLSSTWEERHVYHIGRIIGRLVLVKKRKSPLCPRLIIWGVSRQRRTPPTYWEGF